MIFYARRYIAHLEEEVRLLRQQLGWKPLPEAEKPVERVPDSLVELCAQFETAGHGLLNDCKREHRENGTPYHVIEERLRSWIAAQAPQGPAWEAEN